MNKYIGVRLAGRYEIQEQVGIGGMANVYKARDLIDDITVAVKILKDEYIQNEEFLRRFRNEAKAIAGLSHPNIVKVYDVIYNDDVPAIVMEYIDGITLKEYIEREGVLKWKEALHYTVQTLRALQHAHDKGIVHRDIKPHNIMLLMDGTIKVMDFGIARFARFETKTISGKVIGSVHYISPEQACGDVTDHKTDIYSVGVMLFEMLTGRLPFEADAAVSVAMMQVSKTPARPREINDTIPEGLEEIILKAMQKDTKQRYQSAAEMLRDIDEFKKNPSIQFSYKYLNNDEMPTRHFGAVSNDTENKQAKPQEEKEEENKTPLIPILMGVTSAVVLAVIIFIIVALSKGGIFSSTSALVVPNLIGMHITEAQEKYKEFDFTDYETAYNEEFGEGIIFKQDKDAGDKTKKSKLTVWVSLGAKKGIIPDITEYEVDAAIDALKKAGFTNWTEIPEESSDVAKGLVVRTNPKRGEEVALSTTIQIYKAVEKIEKVQVTNVLGMSIDQAKSLLEAKGLVVEVAEVPSDKDKGIVTYQDVAGDTWVDQGTTVALKVSSGQKPQTSYNISIPIPKFYTGQIELIATLNGEVVKTSNFYADGTAQWSLSLSGAGTGNLVIRINGDVYQAYNINFDAQSHTLVRDDTAKLDPANKDNESDVSSTIAVPETPQNQETV